MWERCREAFLKDKLDGKSKLKTLCEAPWCIPTIALSTFNVAFPVIVTWSIYKPMVTQIVAI